MSNEDRYVIVSRPLRAPAERRPPPKIRSPARGDLKSALRRTTSILVVVGEHGRTAIFWLLLALVILIDPMRGTDDDRTCAYAPYTKFIIF